MADMEEDWDEWGDDADASQAAPEPPIDDPAPPSSSAASPRSNAVPASPQRAVKPEKKDRALLEWDWDLDEIDAELEALAPSSAWEIAPDGRDDLLCELATLAAPTRARLQELGERTRAMRAQALVSQWSLARLQQSLAAQDHADASFESLDAMDRELCSLAREWGACGDMTGAATTEELGEMSAMLQHALSACEDGDVAPFQQAIEQLFGSLPSQSLVVPVSWIRPPRHQEAPPPSPFDAYLQRLVSLCDVDASVSRRVAALTDAETFQDAKDIQRDELVVNGERVAGTLGYEAVVAKIASHVREAVALTTTTGSMDDTTIRHVAQLALHACNRTESGGGSYEILSQFVSNHSMDHVLIRPASAKAPPLEIRCDVGPFRDGSAPEDEAWCFGLRVHVSAVTWYCICEANDPTREFYDVKTTFENRLAFPLGLSPLTRRDLMRRDGGSVVISLRLDDHADRPEHLDLDALM